MSDPEAGTNERAGGTVEAGSGPPTEFEGGYREIDRWEGGVGWIAQPRETLQRASHALAADGEVWVVDPVDCPGLDDLLAEFGEVAGVVVDLDRHTRDADAIARRHDVAVHLPRPLAGVAADLDAPVEIVDGELGGTGYRTITVVDNALWSEVALHDPESGTLLVPEAVGTAEHYLAPGEQLGVHPMLRPRPPRHALSGLDPERVLEGLGRGLAVHATRTLEDALRGARRNAPRLYLETLRSFLGS